MYNSGVTSLKEFALINFTEEELIQKELPKKWENLNNIEGSYVANNAEVYSYGQHDVFEPTALNKNIFPTKSLAEAALALAQLLQLRDKYNEGIDLKLDNSNIAKLAIYYRNDEKEFEICTTYSYNKIFTFKDKDTAELFLSNFKELLWTARELI